MLYNGMEVGDTSESGAPALFENLQVFWPIAERRPVSPVLQGPSSLCVKHIPHSQQGDTEWIANAESSRVLTFFRRSGAEEYLVAINVSNRPFAGVVRRLLQVNTRTKRQW